MAGLGKGLKKGERLKSKAQSPRPEPAVDERVVNAFIASAEPRFAQPSGRPNKRPRRYVRCIFSLNQPIIDDIERLSLLPRTFHSNRSDVVEAAIACLKALPEEQIVAMLRKVK